MFYSQIILSRKGPLGRIWLAAHFEKKLSKSQIFTTDISDAVETLLDPSADLALRVSGHLMLGIVRIYSKKVKYLMIDCTDAMWKMQLAFHPGKVDIDLQPTLNVDDTRFYGNISLDMDYPVLDNIAFVPTMLPLNQPVTFKRKELQEVRDLVSTQLSDIEFVRAGARQSITVSRPSLSFDRKISISSRFEDEVPIFEGDLRMNTSFVPMDIVPPISLNSQILDNQDIVLDVLEYKPKIDHIPVKRRKIIDPVELEDAHRVCDVKSIVRVQTKPHSPYLSSQTLRNFAASIFNTYGYCSELQQISHRVTEGLFPFPMKSSFVHPEEIEATRKVTSLEPQYVEHLEPQQFSPSVDRTSITPLLREEVSYRFGKALYHSATDLT
eukprot:gene4-4_t